MNTDRLIVHCQSLEKCESGAALQLERAANDKQRAEIAAAMLARVEQAANAAAREAGLKKRLKMEWSDSDDY